MQQIIFRLGTDLYVEGLMVLRGVGLLRYDRSAIDEAGGSTCYAAHAYTATRAPHTANATNTAHTTDADAAILQQSHPQYCVHYRFPSLPK